ncbi:putative RNA methyltransferase [Lentzea roselyniae]|uniref:putative RNA methyltransferase n=1 Tax=Lentzea roselyniae TaxID=531940 RepID=UPI003D15DDB4
MIGRLEGDADGVALFGAPSSGRLSPARHALSCAAGHTFDIARHGYVSLLADTRVTSGDDPAVVRASARPPAGSPRTGTRHVGSRGLLGTRAHARRSTACPAGK